MRQPQLRVKYCRPRDWPPGIYLQVKALRWEVIREFRFARQIDADLALAALLRAGITTKRKLLADQDAAIRTAFEALQW